MEINKLLLEKAKPILMSTPMVQACMREIDPKTQTRRVVRIPKWTTASYDELFIDTHGNLCATCDDTGCDAIIKPRYQVGDVLWVRETWTTECGMLQHQFDGKDIHYCADCKDDPTGLFAPCRWKKHPSIHMPREAARLFLCVTDVRAERVQDISTSDCEDEGLILNMDLYNGSMSLAHDDIVGRYADLWNTLNAKRNGGIYSWERNPWVWVYTFERIAGTKNFAL